MATIVNITRAEISTLTRNPRCGNCSRLGGEGFATGMVPISYKTGGVSGVACGFGGAGD